MKLVILERDTYGNDIDFDALEALVDEVVAYPVTAQEDVARRVQDADFVLVNKLLMQKSSLSGAKNLKLLLEGATGGTRVASSTKALTSGVAVDHVTLKRRQI